MNNAILMDFQVDKANNKIKVDRTFDAPVDMVWAAWTQAEILDQWWAPKPWRAVTKEMNFKVGGFWHYYMAGPEGEKHWCMAEYQSITPQKHFSYKDAFCDENMNINTDHPRMHWENKFTAEGDTTRVNIEISFNKLADLETIISMGFKEGFTMGMENLDQYFRAHSKLQKEGKKRTS